MEQFRTILLYIIAISGISFILLGSIMIWGNFEDDTILKMTLTTIVVGIGSSLIRMGIKS
jgi:hypothetical protein